MPFFKTSQEWLEQSALLLEARPTTTRITSRYSIQPVKAQRVTETSDRRGAGSAESAIARPPRASLVLKTYDPVSGITLKYRTTKAQEVTRLVYTSLGRLGRGMAALPQVNEETMLDVDGAVGTSGTAGAEQGSGNAIVPGTRSSQALESHQPQGGSGGKKKKKGKK